jgi:hypothetical protein
MKQSIFLSVVRGWRFSQNDESRRTYVTESKGAREERLRKLQGGAAPSDDFGLPWPPFQLRFWEHTLGAENYAARPAKVLGRLLVPRRALLRVDVTHQFLPKKPLAEVFVLPFGLWTSLTVELAGEWADDRAIADALDVAMKLPVTRSGRTLGQVRDGIARDVVESVLTGPWQNIPAWAALDTLTVTSGLCTPGASETCAPQFRSHFLGGRGGTVHPFTNSDGASATTSRRIGLALGDTNSSAPARIKCLHHNHSLLLGHLLLFSALVSSTGAADSEVYRGWAARSLNHAYRGQPLSDAGIYKSKVTMAWLEQRGLLPAIDAVTRHLPRNPLPPLVKPDEGKEQKDDNEE